MICKPEPAVDTASRCYLIDLASCEKYRYEGVIALVL